MLNRGAHFGLASSSLIICDRKYLSGLSSEMLLYNLSMQLKQEFPSNMCNTPPKGKVRKLKTKSAKSSSASANTIFSFDFLTSTLTTIFLPSSGDSSPLSNQDWFIGLKSSTRGFFSKTKSVKGFFDINDNLRRSTTYTKPK